MPRILLVDDEKDLLEVLSRGLQRKGFEVDAFDNPIEALKKFKPQNYDLILLDVKMSQMSGFELYEKMKEIDFECKIYFISAFELFSGQAKSIVSNISGKNFIQKPVTIKKLVELINTEIGLSQRIDW